MGKPTAEKVMLTLINKIKAFEAKNKKKGSAMLLVMMTMSVIMVIGTSMLFVSLSSYSRSLADTNQQKVQAAAMAVADNIKANVSEIMPLYATLLDNTTEDNPFPMTFTGGATELLVDGTKVSVSMYREVQNYYYIKVSARRNTQTYNVKLRTSASVTKGYSYIEQAFGNAFVMTSNLGSISDDFDTIIKRAEGDISIDVPEGSTKYINAKIIEGISGSVYADGDLVIGSIWNIIQIQGNLYVNGNLTLRGCDLGVLLPSLYTEEMGNNMRTANEGEDFWYKTYVNSTDTELGNVFNFGKVTNPTGANNGEAMYNADNTPMQVYTEGSRPVIELNGAEIIGYYNEYGILKTVDANDGGRDPVVGEIMYKTPDDQNTSNQVPRYPIGGNIYCTGNLIIDKVNQGYTSFYDINNGIAIGNYKLDVNGDLIPNQSYIRGNVYVRGKMIYAPDNAGIHTDTIGQDYSSSVFVGNDGEKFIQRVKAFNDMVYTENDVYHSLYEGTYVWNRFNVKTGNIRTRKYSWNDWSAWTEFGPYISSSSEEDFINTVKGALNNILDKLKKKNLVENVFSNGRLKQWVNVPASFLTEVETIADFTISTRTFREIKFGEDTELYIRNESSISRYNKTESNTNYTLKYAVTDSNQHGVSILDGTGNLVEKTYAVEDIADNVALVVKFHSDFKCKNIYAAGKLVIVSSTVNQTQWYEIIDNSADYTINTKVSATGTVYATEVDYGCYAIGEIEFSEETLGLAYDELYDLTHIVIKFDVQDYYETKNEYGRITDLNKKSNWYGVDQKEYSTEGVFYGTWTKDSKLEKQMLYSSIFGDKGNSQISSYPDFAGGNKRFLTGKLMGYIFKETSDGNDYFVGNETTRIASRDQFIDEMEDLETLVFYVNSNSGSDFYGATANGKAFGFEDSAKSMPLASTVTMKASGLISGMDTAGIGADYDLYLHNDSRIITNAEGISSVSDIFTEMGQEDFALVTVTNTKTVTEETMDDMIEEHQGDVKVYDTFIAANDKPYKQILVGDTDDVAEENRLTNVSEPDSDGNRYCLYEANKINPNIVVMGFYNSETNDALTACDVDLQKVGTEYVFTQKTDAVSRQRLRNGDFVDVAAVQNTLTTLGAIFAEEDSTLIRSQVVYDINESVYFDFEGQDVVFSSSMTGTTISDLLSSMRTRRTVFNINTTDKDIYIYINAKSVTLKKVTFQVTGDHDAYIILVGDTDINVNAYEYSMATDSDDKTDARLGSHFLSLSYTDYKLYFSITALTETTENAVDAQGRELYRLGNKELYKVGDSYYYVPVDGAPIENAEFIGDPSSLEIVYTPITDTQGRALYIDKNSGEYVYKVEETQAYYYSKPFYGKGNFWSLTAIRDAHTTDDLGRKLYTDEKGYVLYLDEANYEFYYVGSTPYTDDIEKLSHCLGAQFVDDKGRLLYRDAGYRLVHEVPTAEGSRYFYQDMEYVGDVSALSVSNSGIPRTDNLGQSLFVDSQGRLLHKDTNTNAYYLYEYGNSTNQYLAEGTDIEPVFWYKRADNRLVGYNGSKYFYAESERDFVGDEVLLRKKPLFVQATTDEAYPLFEDMFGVQYYYKDSIYYKASDNSPLSDSIPLYPIYSQVQATNNGGSALLFEDEQHNLVVYSGATYRYYFNGTAFVDDVATLSPVTEYVQLVENDTALFVNENNDQVWMRNGVYYADAALNTQYTGDIPLLIAVPEQDKDSNSNPLFLDEYNDIVYYDESKGEYCYTDDVYHGNPDDLILTDISVVDEFGNRVYKDEDGVFVFEITIEVDPGSVSALYLQAQDSKGRPLYFDNQGFPVFKETAEGDKAYYYYDGGECDASSDLVEEMPHLSNADGYLLYLDNEGHFVYYNDDIDDYFYSTHIIAYAGDKNSLQYLSEQSVDAYGRKLFYVDADADGVYDAEEYVVYEVLVEEADEDEQGEATTTIVSYYYYVDESVVVAYSGSLDDLEEQVAQQLDERGRRLYIDNNKCLVYQEGNKYYYKDAKYVGDVDNLKRQTITTYTEETAKNKANMAINKETSVTRDVGKLFIVGTSESDPDDESSTNGEGNVMTVGRGGYINAFVYMPNGTYQNQSNGLLDLLPIASSQNNKASIVAKNLNITGSNVGKLVFEAYDPSNSGFSGATIIFDTAEGQSSFETTSSTVWKFEDYVL